MIEFRILGPLEVVENGRPVIVGAPKVRALLAVLLLHRGEVVSTDRLIDALWGERAPATAAKTVQVYVSNLRKALGDGASSSPAGAGMCSRSTLTRTWTASRRWLPTVADCSHQAMHEVLVSACGSR